MSFNTYDEWEPDNSGVDMPMGTFPDIGQDPLDYDDSIGDCPSPAHGMNQ
jgi:hypothetical protein